MTTERQPRNFREAFVQGLRERQEQREAQAIAEELVGPGVQVKDPATFADFLASKTLEFGDFEQQQQANRPQFGSFFGSGLLENVARGATGLGRRFSETVGGNPFLDPSNIQQSNLELQQQTRETLPNPPQQLLDLNQKVLESGADIALGGGVVRGGSQLARAIGVSGPATGAGRIPQALDTAAGAATGPQARSAIDRVSPVGTARAFADEAAGGGGDALRQEKQQIQSRLGEIRRFLQADPTGDMAPVLAEERTRLTTRLSEVDAAIRDAPSGAPIRATSVADEADDVVGQQAGRVAGREAAGSPAQALDPKTVKAEAVETLQEAAPVSSRLTDDQIEAARTVVRQRRAALGTQYVPSPENAEEATAQALATQSDVDTLVNLVKEFTPLREETRLAQEAERRARFARGLARAESAAPTEAGRAVLRELGGPLPSASRFESIRGQFEPDSLTRLYSRIWKEERVTGPRKFDTDRALTKLLSGEVPQPRELELLGQAFGQALPDAIEEIIKSGGRRAWEQFVDAARLPTGLLASFDISAPFRQGSVLTISQPREALFRADSSFGRMLKALGSEEYALAHQEALTNTPLYARVTGDDVSTKLFFHDISGGTNLSTREEAFMSRWLSKVPGIRASERNYATYLNDLRFRTIGNWMDGLRAQGIEPSNDAISRMNQFINAATGRGSLGPAERSKLLREVVSVPFWSPRLMTSRIQTPLLGLRASAGVLARDPAMRAANREIAMMLVKAWGGIATALSLASIGGLATVELDPRSSDWGKLRIGNTRIDPWAGFQQPMRALAQFVTNQRKNATTGRIQQVSGAETIGRFLRSKLAPGAVTILADVAPRDQLIAGFTGGGRSYVGEPVFGPTEPRPSLRGLGMEESNAILERLIDNLTPLLLQDIEEGLESDGALGGVLGATSLIGLGTTSFGSQSGGETSTTAATPQRRGPTSRQQEQIERVFR